MDRDWCKDLAQFASVRVVSLMRLGAGSALDFWRAEERRTLGGVHGGFEDMEKTAGGRLGGNVP